MSGNTQAAHFECIIGNTGTGKTTELKRRLEKIPAANKRRVLVWSPKEPVDNYAALWPDAVRVSSAEQVRQALKKAGMRGGFRLVFVPTLNRKRDAAQFDVVCKMLLAVGSATLIVDELHTVTEASRAVDGWVKVNFMGRAFGLWVFGLSQRPASIDKAFMGSLSFLHVGRLSYPDDQKTCAEFLGVPWAEVAALSGFACIQRDMISGKVTRRA